MRLILAFAMAIPVLQAQACIPTRLLPVDTVTGVLDNSSCQLSDLTAYVVYRLDFPTRGQVQLDLTTAGDFALILRSPSGAKLDSGKSLHRPIEAGNYTLLVNAVTPGQVGSYSLQTSFTPEPGVLCAHFPNAGLHQSIQGTLGVSGCTLPDATLFEAWSLTSLASGTLTVSVSSTDFTPAVILRSQDGYALASGASQVSIPVDADSQYQIVLTTADQAGTYQISTSFQPADGETCVAKMDFTDSAHDNASLSPGSCFVTDGQTGDLAYFAYYNLNVTTAGLADFSATSKDFNPTLSLYDDAGNLLALDAGGGGSPGQAQLRQPLPPGNFVLRVISSVPSGGDYSLDYQFTPGGPVPCPTSPLNPGDSTAATLSAASCRSNLGLADLYTVVLPASGTLRLDLTSPSFTSRLALRDTKDNLVVLQDDLEGLGIAHISAELAAGSYTLAAAATTGSGSYQLASTFNAHEIPACTFVQDLNNNGGYIQKLGPGSCLASDGQPVDYYQFTLPDDATVAAILTSSDFDSFLTLTGPSGALPRSDDNSYGSGGSIMLQYLPAGTYQLAARATAYTPGGYYEVDVRNAPGPRPPFCASRDKLALGSSVAGTISFSGCQYLDATFADLYQISLSADTTIDLRLTSDAFDAQLVLLDAKGNVVDRDDDSGGDTNARVVRALPAGNYLVVAKPLSGYTSAGAYTLSLAQAQ